VHSALAKGINDMKTSKVIDILSDAISGCHEDINLINGSVITIENDREVIKHGYGDSEDYTFVSSVIGTSAGIVRDLWDELPESLQNEKTTEMVRKLYPHLWKENWVEMADMIRDLHSEIYKIWQTMSDVKDKYKIYD
jgi:hypothetical protein